MLDYWKPVATVGTLLFLFSGFLPMISLGWSSMTYSFSLFDVYVQMAQAGQSGTGIIALDITTIGLLLTMVLYPITTILGFASIVIRRIAIVAGILGLVCWIGTIVALSQLNAIQFVGIGVYLGILSAVVIAVAYFLKPEVPDQIMVPPPPPPVPPP